MTRRHTFVREGPITIIRLIEPESDIDLNTGKAIQPTEQEVIYSGNIQPIMGEDLKKLPDGYRLLDTQVMFLHEEIEDNDIVLYHNNRYRVIDKEIWDPNFSTIPHYKYYLEKEVVR